MGLLDQILGGLAGGAGGRAPSLRGGMGGGAVLMSLLPVVLGMLSNRGAAGATSGMGGMGSMGGLGGLIEQFTRSGYGGQVDSWIGTGANEALPEEAVGSVFGEDRLSQIAQQAGVSTDEARSGLSELLPGLVDHLTPQGQLPATDQLSSSVDDFVRRLGA
ncbi:MAG: YidB family protein [Variovorax sp.]